ncbi:lysylphosphatidylglycerol synthase transmembrane domain-containing protein [Flavobacterium suzhouense]|uniref:YbhN family protein n=1 Tax=Flavobacterium suzhouense TaxID=1529638 RepID=A0ABW5NT00_9FLAO
MNKKLSKILSILLPLSVGVFLVIYTYNQFTPAQFEEIKGYFKNADYTYIYLSMLIGLSGHIARAYRWKYTLNHIGYTSPFMVRFSAVCVTYLMNMTVPRSGEVSRALVLKRYSDVPFDKGLGTIISERVVDLFLLLFCVAGTVILQFGTLKEYLTQTIPYQNLIVYGICCVALMGGAILFYMYSKNKWLLKLKEKISGLMEGVLSVAKMPNKWPFMFLSVYIWFSYVLMFYITIFAIPETAQLSFGVVCVGFVIGSLAVTFSNGGFGVYPAALAGVLGLYAIPKEAGTAFGWLTWASQTGLIVCLGALAFLVLPLLYKRK